MDDQVIEQKLESLRRCLQRVKEKCPGDALVLARDLDAQDIVALNLTRAVQLCVDIGAHLIAAHDVQAPSTMGETFDMLVLANLIPEELAHRMKKAVGFRNIAVHNYEVINWDIVFAICQKHLADFRDFAAAVNALLDRQV